MNPIKTFFQIRLQNMFSFKNSSNKEIKNISSYIAAVKIISYEEIININSHSNLAPTTEIYTPTRYDFLPI